LLPAYCRQRGREEEEEEEEEEERRRILGLMEAASLPVALSCIGTAPVLSVGASVGGGGGVSELVR